MTRTRRRPTAAGHTLKGESHMTKRDWDKVPENKEMNRSGNEEILGGGIPSESILSNIPEEMEEEEHSQSSVPHRKHRTDHLLKHPENLYYVPPLQQNTGERTTSTTTTTNAVGTVNPGDNYITEQKYLNTDRHRKMAIAKHAHPNETNE